VPETGLLRVTGPTGAFSIGGLTGGENARRLVIFNSTIQVMTINNQDVLSTSTNRIITPSGANEARGFTVELVYSAAQGRWLLLS